MIVKLYSGHSNNFVCIIVPKSCEYDVLIFSYVYLLIQEIIFYSSPGCCFEVLF